MSLHEYVMSQEIAKEDYPFYALIMAAMRQADDVNGGMMHAAFPAVWTELQQRYNAPGGCLNEGDVKWLKGWEEWQRETSK